MNGFMKPLFIGGSALIGPPASGSSQPSTQTTTDDSGSVFITYSGATEATHTPSSSEEGTSGGTGGDSTDSSGQIHLTIAPVSTITDTGGVTLATPITFHTNTVTDTSTNISTTTGGGGTEGGETTTGDYDTATVGD